MDAQLKARWIEALRSGKYAQGTGALRDNGRYCCLGVLCDVSGVGGWESRAGRLDAYQFGDDASGMTLPTPLLDRADLDIKAQTTLWRMNDLKKQSFPEIADYIEANL